MLQVSTRQKKRELGGGGEEEKEEEVPGTACYSTLFVQDKEDWPSSGACGTA